MNYKRRRPRTAVHRSTKPAFPRGTPAWFSILFNVRPWRRAETRLCRAVQSGEVDADGALWPMTPRKPHVWYW